MPPTLYLSPTLEAALSHARSFIEGQKRLDPFTPVHLLLPGSGAIRTVRRRMGSTIGVRLHQFYALGQAVLEAAGVRVHPLSDTAARRIIHQLLGQMQEGGELTTFSEVWDKPGFNQVILDWLREMKSQGITPEDVRLYPLASGVERDRQLAEVYARYQAFLLERDLVDTDGLLWLAAEALQQDLSLLRSTGSFIALGFDHYNPVQLHILKALSARIAHFAVYLPYDAARPRDSLALARLDKTRRLLEAGLHPAVEELTAERGGPPGLEHLRRTLFEPGGMQPGGENDGVSLIEAPSREAEVRQALKQVKRLLLSGAPAEEIAILAPQPAVYRPLVETVAGEYGLPVEVESRLLANPAMAALTNLLNLYPDFPWRPTLDALRSPYFRQPWLTPEQVAQLERLSRERPVVRGWEQWRYALQPVELPSGDREAIDLQVSDLGPPRLAALLPPEELQAIEQGLRSFFGHLTPPAEATHREYTLWLQEAILGLAPAAEEGDEAGAHDAGAHSAGAHSAEADDAGAETPAPELPPNMGLIAACLEGPYAHRDMQALRLALRCLRGLVSAAELAPPTPDGRIPWAVYRGEVLQVWSAACIPPDPGAGRVLFASLESGRWESPAHLFVLGLSEGEFPRLPAPDPLYAPQERLAHPLPLIRPDPGEDASLWWQVISNCRQSLTLLRPRLDDKGVIWIPSPYWDEVRQRLPDLRPEVIPIGALPAADEAASPAELLLALAQAGSDPPPELARAWQAVQTGVELIRLRQSWEPLTPFEGVFQAEDLRQALGQRFGPGSAWSASRLNNFGSCPYRFFANYALGLQASPDPEEGLDPLTRGQILHALLEALYRRLTAENLQPCLPNQEAVLAHLDACCEELLPRAPERYGFRPGALWRYEQEELRRQLRALIAWECKQNGETPRFTPFRQELRFGIGSGSLHSLRIPLPGGGYFRFHGIIDRVDRDAQGRLRLLDYKSGATGYKMKDILSGQAFQVALYALATETLLGEGQVAESAYLHIPAREFSGHLKFPQGASQDETVRNAEAQAAAFVAQAGRGIFPAAPSPLPSGKLPCDSPCEFAALCRADRHAKAKGSRLSPALPPEDSAHD